MQTIYGKKYLYSEDKEKLLIYGDNEKKIKEQIFELIDSLEKESKNLNEKLKNLKKTSILFCAAFKKSGIFEDMAKSIQDCGAANASGAYNSARAALEKMKQFISNCNSIGNQACQDLSFSLKKTEFKNMLQQLAEGELPLRGDMSGSASGYSINSSSLDNISLYGPRLILNSGGGKNKKEGENSEFKKDYINADTLKENFRLPSKRPEKIKLFDNEPYPEKYREAIKEYYRNISK